MEKSWHALRRLLWAERSNLLSTFGLMLNALLLIATGFLAVYAFRQWRSVDDTLIQRKAQTRPWAYIPATVGIKNEQPFTFDVVAISTTILFLIAFATAVRPPP